MDELIEKLNKKIDLLLIIELTKLGLTKKQIAKVMKISDNTIDKIMPYTEFKKFIGNNNE